MQACVDLEFIRDVNDGRFTKSTLTTLNQW